MVEVKLNDDYEYEASSLKPINSKHVEVDKKVKL
jgi:hypothetical protein